MNERERFLKVMHFEKVDRLFNYEFGYWNETLLRWHKEGLPEEITDNDKADRFFKFDRYIFPPINMGLWPAFERKILEETGEHQIIIDESGIKCEIKKDGTSSIPHYLEFPLKDRKDLKDFIKRLNPHDPRRFPENWDELKKEYKERDYALSFYSGSLLGWIRNWMGIENLSLMIYDDQGMIIELMDHLTDFILEIAKKATQGVTYDAAHFWEDICFNHGPLVSPRFFEKFLVPRYKVITDFLKRKGIDVFFVDCDGNINELVPLFLEGGVNCMFPLEINSGTDPLSLRQRYGQKVLLSGGVDKIALIKGREAIKKELHRLKELVASGGYIPHVDHRVPPDVSYSDYLYYLEAKKDIFTNFFKK